jgi:hypothetical protein
LTSFSRKHPACRRACRSLDLHDLPAFGCQPPKGGAVHPRPRRVVPARTTKDHHRAPQSTTHPHTRIPAHPHTRVPALRRQVLGVDRLISTHREGSELCDAVVAFRAQSLPCRQRGNQRVRLVLWKRQILPFEAACPNNSAEKGSFLVAILQVNRKSFKDSSSMCDWFCGKGRFYTLNSHVRMALRTKVVFW